jgi:phosphate transport system substrate-binding protein
MSQPAPARTAGLLALAGTLCVLAACGRQTQTPGGESAAAPSLIRIDGSSTVFPITEAVAEEFQRAAPAARVTVRTSGTGGGFQKFCRGETDISNASRPIRDVEIDACSKGGVTFVELPIAYDGLTIVIHPKNTWAGKMTVAELKKLWEPAAEGKITKWSQVRDGWPDREIHLFGAGVDSGTFDYFTEVIVGKSGASRGDYTSSEDDNMLVQGVSGDELALGFFGFAYYDENRSKLQAVAIDDGNETNGAGAIAPSVETVRGGTYRPLSRPVFIYVSRASLGRPEVKQFTDFYVEHAKKLVAEVGYVPLTDAEYALVAQRVKKQTAGSMFASHHMEPNTTIEKLLSAAQ